MADVDLAEGSDDLGGMFLPSPPRPQLNAPAPLPTLHVNHEDFHFVKNYLPGESPNQPRPSLKHKLSSSFISLTGGGSSSAPPSQPREMPAVSPIEPEAHCDKRQRRIPWTNTEDVTILALHRHLGTQWDKMAAQLPGRTADAVRNRCFRLQKQHPMASENDAIDGLVMVTHGIEPPEADAAKGAAPRNRTVSAEHGRHAWSAEEDRVIVKGVNELGCKWREIAKFLPGRTDSMCRNRWMRLQKERYEQRTDSQRLDSGRSQSPPGDLRAAVVAPVPAASFAAQPIPLPASAVVDASAASGPSASTGDVEVTMDELTAAATAAVDSASPRAPPPAAVSFGTQSVPLGLGSPENIFDLECFANIAFEVEAEAEAAEAAEVPQPEPEPSSEGHHTRIGAAFLAAFAALSFGGLLKKSGN